MTNSFSEFSEGLSAAVEKAGAGTRSAWTCFAIEIALAGGLSMHTGKDRANRTNCIKGGQILHICMAMRPLHR